jgi:hypothetical protein
MENADQLAASHRTAGGSALRQWWDDVRASPLTYAIVVGGVAIQLVLVLAHGVNSALLGDGSFLALDRDHNVPAWYETALFVVAGLGCWLLAWLRPAIRVPLVLLGLVALLLSFEQMAQLHGSVEEDLGDTATAIEALMALGLVAVVWLAARGLPRLSKILLWGAIVAIAVAQGSSTINSDDLPHAVVVFLQTLEEVGEMTTATLLIAAVAQPVVDGIVARVLREGRPTTS